MNIIWKASPNFDTSRKPIKQVVIHWIVGTLASADAIFQKAGGVSAHYGIEDNIIHQYVKEADVAYAVGVYTRNQETISIEHSASPDRLASNSTYSTSAWLVADICKRNNIPLDREHIIGHNQIKATQCPGTIDIDRIIREAKALLNPEFVFTDQTRIPLGRFGEIEIQAIRGKLSDLEIANKQLIEANTKFIELYHKFTISQEELEDVRAQLINWQTKPPNASNEVTYSWNGLVTYFGHLVSKTGS